MSPANGSTLRSLSTIKVTFPDATDLNFNEEELDPMPEITLTNGTKSYNVNAETIYNSSWTAITGLNISVVDDEYVPAKVTEAGEWTLTIDAGFLATATETSPEIIGTFTIDPEAPISWTASPENGSKQDLPNSDYMPYTNVTFTFDADKASLTAKDEMAGIRVKYRGTEVSRVEDLYAEDANGYTIMSDDYEPNNIVFRFTNNVFEAPGLLTIETDEGAFTMNGDENDPEQGEASPAINYSVTFGNVKNYTYVFTPANDTEVESIKEFTLEFPEASEAYYDEDNSYIILAGAGWICPTNPTVTIVKDAENPTFKLTFDCIGETVTPKAGSYSLRIGEGTFLLDDDQKSPEMSASWTLKRTTPIDLTWTAEPVRDIVNDGYGIYPAIIFNENEEVSVNSESEEKIIVKFNDVEIEVGTPTDEKMTYSTRIEGMMPNAFMFIIYGGALSNAETEGTLTITIPAGALLVSGEPCEKIEHSWQIVKKKEYEVKVTPAEGSVVNSLKDFRIEFIGAETAELNFSTGIAVRSTDYKYQGVIDANSIKFDNEDGNAVVYFSLEDELTNDAAYLLQVYADAFILDGCQFSSEIKVNYTVDQVLAINGIEAANGKYTVTNLAGITVLRNANAAALSKLPAGLYIVNGKKVMLNK